MSRLEELIGRTLVIVPHPDDECLAYGTILQRMREPHVVYVTDGAPHDPYFWKQYGSREAYTELRQREARTALSQVGVLNVEFSTGIADQEVFRELPKAMDSLRRLIQRLRPEALATLAYEGGHPDHDSCNVLTSELAREFSLPAWEAPLYHRQPGNPEGHVVQDFVTHDGNEEFVRASEKELRRKRAMAASYPSQGDFLKTFDVERELMRPMHCYDYTRPPHEGLTNYEVWQWSMTATEVSRAFESFLDARLTSNR